MRKRFKETGIINLLRGIEVKVAEGRACRMRVAVRAWVMIKAIIAGVSSTAVWAAVK